MTNFEETEDIIKTAAQVPVCSVSTFAGSHIRRRMTLFAVSLYFYVGCNLAYSRFVLKDSETKKHCA